MSRPTRSSVGWRSILECFTPGRPVWGIAELANQFGDESLHDPLRCDYAGRPWGTALGSPVHHSNSRSCGRREQLPMQDEAQPFMLPLSAAQVQLVAEAVNGINRLAFAFCSPLPSATNCRDWPRSTRASND